MAYKDFAKKDRYVLGFDGSDMSSYSHVQNENVENEVESSDISLDSFKLKNNLNGKVWDKDGNLDPKVRLSLLEISDDFWKECEIKWVKPESAILTGSICNFNWSRFSDIDLHLIVDFSKIHENSDFVKEYFNEKKNTWNSNHKDLKIYGYPIELYVQDVDDDVTSGGIYDLYENKWVRKPSKDELSPLMLDKYAIKKVSARIMTEIDDLYNAFMNEKDKHRIELIGRKCKKLKKELKELRDEGLEDSEMGFGNICYKVVRRSGYLDKLRTLRNKIYDSVKSIDESIEFRRKIRKMF